MEVFAEGVISYGRTDTVCYNGDINSVADYERFTDDFPDILKVMIGRGMIADPCIAERIKSAAADRDGVDDGDDLNIATEQNGSIGYVDSSPHMAYDWDRFFAFHDELYRNYCESDVGRGNTMFKMKELWAYWSRLFVDMEGAERALKKIRKTSDNGEYEAAVKVLAALCR